MMEQNSIKRMGMKEVSLKLNNKYNDIILKYLTEVKNLNLKASSIYTREYIAKILLYYLQLNNVLEI